MAKTDNKKQIEAKELRFANGGELIVLYNPAPLYQRQVLSDAEANGEPILRHRNNTQWVLTIPALNVTMPLVVNNTPVVGYQKWEVLERYADSIITQLKDLAPEELEKYQTVLPDFREWSQDELSGGLFKAAFLPK